MKATYYIGGREVSREDWDKPLSQWDSADIAQHCRTSKAFPEILSQEELERDYAEDKRTREEMLGYVTNWPKVSWWMLPVALVGFWLWFKAIAWVLS